MEGQQPAVRGVEFDAEFYPGAGPGKKPGVVVLATSEGGIPDRRAQQIAEGGFPSLALGYFKTERTPGYLDMIPLEYFDQPIEWLMRNEHTDGSGVVLMGESKGAELALLLASRKPEVRGVVAFVPSSVVFQGIPEVFWPPRSSWSQGGEPVPFVPYDSTGVSDPNDILALYRNSLRQQEAVEAATIPVERTNGPILLFSAGDDRMWPSVEMCGAIVHRLDERGFGHGCEHITYETAGHTMTEYFMMGGTEEGNREARLDSTKRVLAFLGRISGQ